MAKKTKAVEGEVKKNSLPAEVLAMTPKKVLTRFNPVMKDLESLMKNRSYIDCRTMKQKQVYYSQIVKIINFFHGEMCKFFIDFYLETTTNTHHENFELSLSIYNYAEFTVSDKKTYIEIWGSSKKWIKTSNLDSDSDIFTLQEVKKRLELLLEWHAVLHYYAARVESKEKPVDLLWYEINGAEVVF